MALVEPVVRMLGELTHEKRIIPKPTRTSSIGPRSVLPGVTTVLAGTRARAELAAEAPTTLATRQQNRSMAGFGMTLAQNKWNTCQTVEKLLKRKHSIANCKACLAMQTNNQNSRRAWSPHHTRRIQRSMPLVRHDWAPLGLLEQLFSDCSGSTGSRRAVAMPT